MQPERNSPVSAQQPAGSNPLTMERLQGYDKPASQSIGSYSRRIKSTQAQLQSAQQQSNNVGNSGGPKRNKPPTFDGKGSVDSFLQHINEYCKGAAEGEKLAIAVSYLTSSADEWYICTKVLEESSVLRYNGFCSAISKLFNPIDKVRTARDKLAKWRQIKSVQIYSQSFLEIILDLPTITEDEKVDRYCRGQTYIWELCTKAYTSLDDVMNDAERVEAAKGRKLDLAPTSKCILRGANSTNYAPMELGAVNVKKLTPEERDICMRQGLCLRCRQPGQMAKDCRQFNNFGNAAGDSYLANDGNPEK
jgi:Retrotransposon gag protein